MTTSHGAEGMASDISGRGTANGWCRSTGARDGGARRARAARLLLAAGLLGAAAIGGAARADVKVAFLGDQGGDSTARAVLDLVHDEGSELLVLQGDFAYDWGISSWVRHMEGALGPDFPVIGVVGNHEESDWPIYRAWFETRIDRVSGLDCDGEVGVKAHCTYRGISVVQVAPGITEVPGVSPDDDYPGYIERSFASDPNAWRVCSFHKMMRRMQVGLKSDRTGWGVYEACREAGALVATAHSHTYSRTHLLSDFESQTVVDSDGDLEIGPGRTIAFVSGLGGKSVRAQARGGDWWGSIHTATQGATHGALFCTFGDARANCEFKDIAGGVADRFTLRLAGGAVDAEGDEAADEVPAEAVVETPDGADEDAGEAVAIRDDGGDGDGDSDSDSDSDGDGAVVLDDDGAVMTDLDDPSTDEEAVPEAVDVAEAEAEVSRAEEPADDDATELASDVSASEPEPVAERAPAPAAPESAIEAPAVAGDADEPDAAEPPPPEDVAESPDASAGVTEPAPFDVVTSDEEDGGGAPAPVTANLSAAPLPAGRPASVAAGEADEAPAIVPSVLDGDASGVPLAELPRDEAGATAGAPAAVTTGGGAFGPLALIAVLSWSCRRARRGRVGLPRET